jgi:HD-like signal output (HDOD) protein
LLHDIGKVIVSQFLTEEFGTVSARMKSEGISFNEAEKGMTDMDHAGIGAYVAKRWNLPPGLVDAIRYHHEPRKSAQDLELLLVVHGANVLSHFMEDGFAKQEGEWSPERLKEILCERMHPDAIAALEKALKMFPKWSPQASKEIESARIFFQGV